MAEDIGRSRGLRKSRGVWRQTGLLAVELEAFAQPADDRRRRWAR